MTYAVTGSTGALGTLAVQHLLALKTPASSIVALVRDEAKAKPLAALGVAVRRADYTDPASLEKAFKGVDRVLLISSNAVGQRFTQHQNVIHAAQAAGVKLVAYTSLAHADTSANPLAPEHKATEAALRASGLPFVILRNNWYTENYTDDVKRAQGTGVIAAAVGNGRVASATRSEYAEAAVRALIGDGHAGRVYELAGPAWSYADLAAATAAAVGRPVVFQNLTPAERRSGLLAAGLPEGVADFVTALDQGIADGTLAQTSPDLATLLGRAPLPLTEAVKTLLK